jgi:kynurenine formamidase
MTYHDLTITMSENTLPFPDSGDPHMTWKHLVDHDVYKCQVSLFSMVTHIGTHVDAPLHYVKGGKTTAEIDLRAYCGSAVCLDMTGAGEDGKKIDIAPTLRKNAATIAPGDIILLYTGWESKLGTPEYFASPDFEDNTGAALGEYGAVGIGFDLSTIDRSGVSHQDVLGRGMSIVESLVNLKPLIGKRFFFSAAPLKFADGDGSPTRAYAIVED